MSASSIFAEASLVAGGTPADDDDEDVTFSLSVVVENIVVKHVFVVGVVVVFVNVKAPTSWREQRSKVSMEGIPLPTFMFVYLFICLFV
jgi:hypothetical protein